MYFLKFKVVHSLEYVFGIMIAKVSSPLFHITVWAVNFISLKTNLGGYSSWEFGTPYIH